MPVSQVCINARAALAEIHSLKDAFDLAFKAAIESGLAQDIETCEQLKRHLIQRIEHLELDIASDGYNKQLICLKILERKHIEGEAFTRDDLSLLYEVDSAIDRYTNPEDRIDERLNELRSSRDVEQDMLVVFECTPGQIARSVDQINESTRAYIGPLAKGIFNHLPNTIDYIHTKFPESRIRRQSLEIGGKTKEELIQLLNSRGFSISDIARFMMDSDSFTTLNNPEELKLIRLTVAQLGLKDGATTVQIFARANELGLELCPAEVGPHYRLQYTDQSIGEWFAVGMERLAGGDGHSSIFAVARLDGGLWLLSRWDKPLEKWDADTEFAFCLRNEV